MKVLKIIGAVAVGTVIASITIFTASAFGSGMGNAHYDKSQEEQASEEA